MGHTTAEAKRDKEVYLKQIRDEIQEEKEKLQSKKRECAVEPAHKTKLRRRTRLTPLNPRLAGRRVTVPSEVFDLPGEIYLGVVHHWGKYVDARREKMWG